MTDRLLGFVSWLKQDTSSVIPSSSVIHRQAMTSKKLNPLSLETLAKAIKVIIFFLKVDHWILHTLLFQTCSEIHSEHNSPYISSQI